MNLDGILANTEIKKKIHYFIYFDEGFIESHTIILI